MSINQTTIQGDQSISRDLTVGGKAKVRSSAEFDRNVAIKGWLEAPNIKHAYKGLYSTEEDLCTAYPKPQAGWYALVADIDSHEGEKLEDIALVYFVINGEWSESGITSGQLNDYVDTIEKAFDELSEEVKDDLEKIRADISETLKNYVTFDDEAIADGVNDRNGVFTTGEKYQLMRLHKASAHISYWLSGEHSIIQGKPASAVTAIYYLPDMKTFAASTVGEEEAEPVLYSQWDENVNGGFHASDEYITAGGLPINKLYINGVYCYVWDNNLQEMRLLGNLRDYVTFTDYATDSKTGVVKVPANNGLSVDSVGNISMALATETSAGAMSAEDKTKLDKAVIDEATESSAGLMSASDKTILNYLSYGIPLLSGILTSSVSALNEECDEVYRVWWSETLKAFIGQKSNGVYYTSWKAGGAYLSSDYYTKTTDRAYNNMGVLYRYDQSLDTLVKLCDLTKYITIDDLATEDTAGLMSPEDVWALEFVYDAIHSGRITNGTMRFNNYCCTKNLNGTIDEKTEATEWDGVMWLCDRKMFVAYKAITTLDDCNNATVTFTFYTHWSTAHLYMEHIAEEEGLWKDKLYIYAGHTYQWKSCESQLVLSGGAGDYEVITNEEIDEMMADFEFVTPSEVTGITSIDMNATEPLVATVSNDNGKATIDLSITEATEKEVDDIFNKEE